MRLDFTTKCSSGKNVDQNSNQDPSLMHSTHKYGEMTPPKLLLLNITKDSLLKIIKQGMVMLGVPPMLQFHFNKIMKINS